MVIGFTGTREGLTEPQISRLRLLLVQLRPIKFLHGGAIGADSEAHRQAQGTMRLKDIEIYPCSKERSRHWLWLYRGESITIHQIQPPLIRNHIIVDRSNQMLACPAEYEEQPRGGTWSTIRYARKQHKPLTIIYPDGSIGE